MFKKLPALLATLFSLNSLAAEVVVPDTLYCTPTQAEYLSSFELQGLNQEKATLDFGPEDSVNGGADFYNKGVEGQNYNLGFSNGCDNSFSFTFFAADLTALKKGKVTKVTGLLNYFNANSSDAAGEDGQQDETVAVVCTATKPTR
jgi:hypothetical protein